MMGEREREREEREREKIMPSLMATSLRWRTHSARTKNVSNIYRSYIVILRFFLKHAPLELPVSQKFITNVFLIME
jgi:hypothetical protein